MLGNRALSSVIYGNCIKFCGIEVYQVSLVVFLYGDLVPGAPASAEY
jgi:hypothetical protein